MEDKIRRIIKKSKRKSFEIKTLEEILIQTFKDKTAYNSAGGYKSFAKAILSLEKEGLIRGIKSSPYYYKKPNIKSKYVRIDESVESSWDAYTFMVYSNLLDLSYFKRYKKEQNDKNLKYIERIYEFIQKREKRVLASREERALEIFDDEKYLITSDNILKKIKLNPNLNYRGFDEALKMEKNTQMFVFFEEQFVNNNRVLILENQSTFFTVKRLLSENISFFERNYHYIIWGQGKGIIKQLEMLSKITNPKNVIIDYFGDIDPEGYFIFLKLKEKYSNLTINFLEEAYKALLKEEQFYPYQQKQSKNDSVLEDILKYFTDLADQELIRKLWRENLRIPQEIITYEYIIRRENNGH